MAHDKQRETKHRMNDMQSNTIERKTKKVAPYVVRDSSRRLSLQNSDNLLDAVQIARRRIGHVGYLGGSDLEVFDTINNRVVYAIWFFHGNRFRETIDPSIKEQIPPIT